MYHTVKDSPGYHMPQYTQIHTSSLGFSCLGLYLHEIAFNYIKIQNMWFYLDTIPINWWFWIDFLFSYIFVLQLWSLVMYILCTHFSHTFLLWYIKMHELMIHISSATMHTDWSSHLIHVFAWIWLIFHSGEMSSDLLSYTASMSTQAVVLQML